MKEEKEEQKEKSTFSDVPSLRGTDGPVGLQQWSHGILCTDYGKSILVKVNTGVLLGLCL